MTIHPHHTPKGAVFTRLVLEIFRLNGALLAAGDRMGADLGLSSARWQVMGALADQPRTVPHIAREMGLTRQGVQRTVNILEAEGLARLIPNPHHKRAKLVELSPEGATRLKMVSERQAVWANELAEKLDLADLETALLSTSILRGLMASGESF
ncbi:MarR family transcriptional regulator [Rhodospirillaceae bacterium LM-1]|nr:MarR family transcriptional regulator [Rhodospirillaceae bacterium LM-1]